MLNFIDPKDHTIYSYEDDVDPSIILPGLVPIGDLELAALRAAQAQEASLTVTKSEAEMTRDQLLTVAALRIAPLQDAVDLDTATEADLANLRLWKIYRVAVNRALNNLVFPTKVVWPEEPTS